jgi:hypothetical protein
MTSSWIYSGIAALALGAIGLAGPIKQHHQGGGHHQVASKFIADLELAPTQVEAIHGIFRKLHEGMANLHQGGSMSTGERTKAAAALKSQTETDILALLSPAQQTKFRKMHGLDGLMGLMFDHLHQALLRVGLSDAQRNTVDRIAAEARASHHRLLKDPTLTPEIRQAKLHALHESLMKQIHETLTPAQLEKAHRVMQNRHGGSSH